jgi:hypothetical protein
MVPRIARFYPKSVGANGKKFRNEKSKQINRKSSIMQAQEKYMNPESAQSINQSVTNMTE